MKRTIFNNLNESNKNQKTTWTHATNHKEPTSNLHAEQRTRFQTNLKQSNTSYNTTDTQNNLEQFPRKNETSWTTQINVKTRNNLKQPLKRQYNRNNIQQTTTTEKKKTKTTVATYNHSQQLNQPETNENRLYNLKLTKTISSNLVHLTHKSNQCNQEQRKTNLKRSQTTNSTKNYLNLFFFDTWNDIKQVQTKNISHKKQAKSVWNNLQTICNTTRTTGTI